MKYGLLDNQLKVVEKALQSHSEVEEAVLFGSRAIGSFKEASDVDIALKGKKADTALALSLKSYFEEETNLPYFFDFLSYSNISNKKLKNHIDKYGVVIYRKGWRRVKLGDVAQIISGQSPKGKFYNENKQGIPFYQGKKEFREIYLGEPVKWTVSVTKTANPNDILMSVRAPVGPVNITLQKICIGRGLASIRAKNKINQLFLFYYLKQNQDKIIGSGGSVFDSINQKSIKEIKISLPPLPEQKAIAEVLSSLDDKIELLHKQNKTLENIAQTLFRKWFIEDAKKDWEKKPLDKIADYLNGLACQKYPPKSEIDKLPVLKIKELRNGFTENSDWATSEVEDRYIIELGDIIFSWSGSLLLKIWDGQKCVLNQHLFKITSKQYPKWFYYFWTRYYMEKFIGIADSKATTMGHIKREDLSNSMALVPSKSELSKMNKLINPQFEKVTSNLKSILKLEKLRNTLLPKLMNGFIKIKY